MKIINEKFFLEVARHCDNNLVVYRLYNGELFTFNFIYLAKRVISFSYSVREKNIFILIILENFSEVIFLSYSTDVVLNLKEISDGSYLKSDLGRFYKEFNSFIVKKISNPSLTINSKIFTDNLQNLKLKLLTCKNNILLYALTVEQNCLMNITVNVKKSGMVLNSFKCNSTNFYIEKILQIQESHDSDITGNDYEAIAIVSYDRFSFNKCIQKIFLANLDHEILQMDEIIYLNLTKDNRLAVKIIKDKIYICLDFNFTIYDEKFNKLFDIDLKDSVSSGNLNIEQILIKEFNNNIYLGLFVNADTFNLYKFSNNALKLEFANKEFKKSSSLILKNSKLHYSEGFYLECDSIATKKFVIRLDNTNATIIKSFNIKSEGIIPLRSIDLFAVNTLDKNNTIKSYKFKCDVYLLNNRLQLLEEGVDLESNYKLCKQTIKLSELFFSKYFAHLLNFIEYFPISEIIVFSYRKEGDLFDEYFIFSNKLNKILLQTFEKILLSIEIEKVLLAVSRSCLYIINNGEILRNINFDFMICYAGYFAKAKLLFLFNNLGKIHFYNFDGNDIKISEVVKINENFNKDCCLINSSEIVLIKQHDSLKIYEISNNIISLNPVFNENWLSFYELLSINEKFLYLKVDENVYVFSYKIDNEKNIKFSLDKIITFDHILNNSTLYILNTDNIYIKKDIDIYLYKNEIFRLNGQKADGWYFISRNNIYLIKTKTKELLLFNSEIENQDLIASSESRPYLDLYPVSEVIYMKRTSFYIALIVKFRDQNFSILKLYKFSNFEEIASIELTFHFNTIDIAIKEEENRIIIFLFVKSEKDFLVFYLFDSGEVLLNMGEKNINEIDKKLLIENLFLIPNSDKIILFSAYGNIQIYEYDFDLNLQLVYEFCYSSHLCQVSLLRNEYDNREDLIKLFELDIENKVFDRYILHNCFIIENYNYDEYEVSFIALVLNYGIVFFESLIDKFTLLSKFKYSQQISFNERVDSFTHFKLGINNYLLKCNEKCFTLKQDSSEKFVLLSQ
jgi:hypothetical protein